jgi:Nrap protein PAP/OAS-like domain/Nrap protein domain 3
LHTRAVALSLTEEALESISQAFSATLLDPTSQLNLFAHVSRDALQEVRAAAQLAVELLSDDAPLDVFSQLFEESVEPSLSYDYHCRFVLRREASTGDLEAQHSLSESAYWSGVRDHVGKVLRRGLSDRVMQVRLFASSPHLSTSSATTAMPSYRHVPSSWSLTAASPPPTTKDYVAWLSIRVHPTRSRRLVDRGPTAENVEEVCAGSPVYV